MPLFQFQSPYVSKPIYDPNHKPGGILGFIDQSGSLVIAQKYGWSAYSHFNEAGRCIVRQLEGGLKIVIDETDTCLLELPPEYETPEMNAPDEFGIFAVEHLLDYGKKNAFKVSGHDLNYTGRSRHIAMNLKGEVAFEAKIGRGAEGYYPFSNPADGVGRQKYGIINHLGDVVVQPQFDKMIFSQTDSCITVTRDGLLGVIDFHGKEITPIKHPVQGFHQEREVVDGVLILFDAAKGNCFAMNLQGEVLGRFPATYWSSTYPRACPRLSEGMILITQQRGSAGTANYYLDVYGKPAMKGRWGRTKKFTDYRVNEFHEGLTTYQKDGNIGFIDKAGQVVIEPQFESVTFFKNGLSRVFATKEDRVAGRMSYINTSGKVVASNFD